MRLHAIAGFALLTLAGSIAAGSAADEPAAEWRLNYTRAAGFETGTGTAPEAGQATYIRGQGDNAFGTLERTIPADAWRGKRVRLTLRLRNEAGSIASVAFQVDKANNVSLRAFQPNPAGGWQTHQFVLDVPGNATQLVLGISLRGKGAGWVDGVALEQVGADVALSQSQRIYTPPDIASTSPRRGNYGYPNNGGYPGYNGFNSWGNQSVYGPDPTPNPYSSFAPSTLNDMRNNSSLQH